MWIIGNGPFALRFMGPLGDVIYCTILYQRATCLTLLNVALLCNAIISELLNYCMVYSRLSLIYKKILERTIDAGNN